MHAIKKIIEPSLENSVGKKKNDGKISRNYLHKLANWHRIIKGN